MSKEKPTPLIILGMHRSGTSCLAGMLEQAGVNLGSVSSYNQHNKKGNKENIEIMKLNNKILKFNQASWDIPPKTLIWNEEHEIEGRLIIQNINKDCNSKYWGFKDPRVLLVLPFWNKLLPSAKYIGTFREPLSVAKSLNNRDPNKISINFGLELWLTYNLRLIDWYKTSQFPIISFDLTSEEYLKSTLKIYKIFNLPIQNPAFFDSTLRHQKQSRSQQKYTQKVSNTYKQLLDIFRKEH